MKNFLALFVVIAFLVSPIAQAQDERGRNFTLADLDRSSSLDSLEFRKFIQLLAKAGHRNAQRVRMFRLYSLAWKRVDKNGDGFATRRELLSARMSFKGKEKEPGHGVLLTQDRP